MQNWIDLGYRHSTCMQTVKLQVIDESVVDAITFHELESLTHELTCCWKSNDEKEVNGTLKQPVVIHSSI